MQVKIFDDKVSLGTAAAKAGAEKIRKALADNGKANIILATGASQFEMLAALLQEPGIDWSKIRIFRPGGREFPGFGSCPDRRGSG